MKSVLAVICIISLSVLLVEAFSPKCFQWNSLTAGIFSLSANDCPNAPAGGCVSSFYKYNRATWSYGGPSAVSPAVGEVNAFITVDASGSHDFVFIGRPTGNGVQWTVDMQILGFTSPIKVKLMDDPDDTHTWPTAGGFSGKFNFSTSSNYTDGFVLGPLNFDTTNNDACFRFTIISKALSFNQISLINGTTAGISRISKPYFSNVTHTFCVQPRFKLNKGSCGAYNLTNVSGVKEYKYSWLNSAGVKIGWLPKVSLSSVGTYRVQVEDQLGCQNERKFIYASVDAERPEFTFVPLNATVECGQSTHPNATGLAIATSPCGLTVTVRYVDTDFDGYCGRGVSVRKIIQRTWTATDSSGNSATAVQYIEIVRRTPPCFIPPSDCNRTCSLFDKDNLLTTGVANVLDLCVSVNLCKPDITVTLQDDLTIGLCSNLLSAQVVLRKWVAVDVCNLLNLEAWQRINVLVDL